MSDQDTIVQDEQLDEFKASMGDPSEVPGPTNTKAKAPGNSKNVEDDPQDSPTAVKPGKAQEPKTKMGMIQAMVDRMNGMKKTDLQAAYGKMHTAMESFDADEADESVDVVEVVKAGHKITAQDVDIAEDIKALFAADDSLSEEFKEKATTIFEAAVIAKINEQLEKYVVDVESELAEEKNSMSKDLVEKLDQYLDYVVEEWMSENTLAVSHGLKAEITEDFINGLKDLFTEHYIDVPDDKVDVVEELAARADELEGRLNEQLEKNSVLKAELAEQLKDDVFAEACDSLTETQKEKFRVLAEGIDFINDDDYAEKLKVVKESYFSENNMSVTSTAGDFDDAEPLDEEATAPRIDPEMSAYLNAISRTVKK